MMMSFGSWSRAEMMASFCFIPCEYAEIGWARSPVRSNRSAYFSIRASRSVFDTPKISATKFRYLTPERNSYRSGLSGM